MSAGVNRYRYNGKELNTDIGLYDYGARWYDPVTARWGVIDPHADTYVSLSTYNYVANNPIAFIDPTGKDLIFYLQDGTDKERAMALSQLVSLLSSSLSSNSFSLDNTSDGGFSLSVDGNNSGRKDFQIHAEHYISQIVDDDFTTRVGVFFGNADIIGGSYELEAIDVADMAQFPENKGIGNNEIRTRTGILIHELYETYDKQKNNRPDIGVLGDMSGYNISHGLANIAQQGVDGNVVVNSGFVHSRLSKSSTRSKENAVGYRADFYNPATGETYIERIIFSRGEDSRGEQMRRQILQVAKPEKIK